MQNLTITATITNKDKKKSKCFDDLQLTAGKKESCTKLQLHMQVVVVAAVIVVVVGN